MKHLRVLYLYCLFLVVAQGLIAQVASVEILDHSDHRTILTSFLENKGDIIYVVENDRWGYPSTQVKVSDGSSIPTDVLSEELSFRSHSKWFYDSQGNLRIYLFGLSDGASDNFSADFVEVKEGPTGYTSKRITNPFLISVEGVNCVAMDGLDNIYTLTNYPRLQLWQNDVMVDEIMPVVNHSAYLHNNDVGDVFLIDTVAGTVHKVNDLQMELVASLELNIEELKNIDGALWARSAADSLYLFSADFEGSPQLVPIPFLVRSLDQVSDYGDGVFILEPLVDGFALHTYAGDSISFESTVQEEFAYADKIHAINDSSFLAGGQFEVEGIASHAFVRGYQTNEEFNPDRRNVQLSEVEMFYIKDTIIPGAPWDLWWYGVSYQIENIGSSDAGLISVFTSRLIPDFGLLYEHHLERLIGQGDVVEVDSTKLVQIYHPSEVRASITGADYKFNESYTPVVVGIMTSTADITTDASIAVYPNPFTSYVNVEAREDAKFRLFDSEGKLIYSGSVKSLQLTDLSTIPSGNYYLQEHEGGELIKLVKIRQ